MFHRFCKCIALCIPTRETPIASVPKRETLVARVYRGVDSFRVCSNYNLYHTFTLRTPRERAIEGPLPSIVFIL